MYGLVGENNHACVITINDQSQFNASTYLFMYSAPKCQQAVHDFKITHVEPTRALDPICKNTSGGECSFINKYYLDRVSLLPSVLSYYYQTFIVHI